MADDLQEIREQFDADMEAWEKPRLERAKDMRFRSGDPWDPADRIKRNEAHRPILSVDELSQYTNQIVNDMRVNPLSVSFAPGPPITAGKEQILASEKGANLYSDKWREIEYRSYAHEAYATCFENCVNGSYGYVRLVSEYGQKSFEQELRIKSVVDPNTVLPDPEFQSPDLSDMRRCTVLERRSVKEFKAQFPKAKVKDFESYLKDDSYSKWIGEDKILLAESWRVQQIPCTWLLVQPPSVEPPSGSFGFRPAVAPPPITIAKDDWAETLAEMPGSTVLQERDDFKPKVVQQLVNGVEILDETTWPGLYIPIAGCLGPILYLDNGGDTERVILSAIRLARDPYMAYCWWQTSKLEMAGMITKNPYWAYEGQVTPEQQQEIAKSLHEPVTILVAKAVTAATGQQILPLPQRNPLTTDISTFEIGAENMRRGIQSAMGGNFLPTAAQKHNEKSGVALESIRQNTARGTYHFFDHYKAMRRHIAVLGEAALDAFYDTKRQITVRRRNETNEAIWINDPTNKEAIDVRGSFTVDVSDGPHVDSTRQAAENLTDALLGSEMLMTLLGPQKATKIAALAVKLKVRQTGIGAIGDEIVDIIDPPPPDEGEGPSVEQLQAQVQQADQLLQMAKQQIQELEQDKQAGLSKEKAKTERDLLLADIDGKLQAFLLNLKGQQAERQIALKGTTEIAKQDDAQRHDMGIAAADAEHADRAAARVALTTLAGGASDGGNGNGAQP